MEIGSYRNFLIPKIAMSVKQVIVWRHDLNCRLGKKMAQAGHAALANLFASFSNNVDAYGNVSFQMTPEQFEWYLGNQKKIVLRVDSESDLLLLKQRGEEMGLPIHLITDAGLTEWNEVTNTCLAIGPYNDVEIDLLVGEKGPLGKLKLL